MGKRALNILRCKHRKIFKVRMTIFQHYAWKDQANQLNVAKMV